MVVDLSAMRGFGPVLLERVRERWPELLHDQELRTNPYLLCAIRGVGFKLADEVGRKLGIGSASPHRVSEGADYALGQLENNGHTAVSDWAFYRKLSDLLGFDASRGLPIPSIKVQRIAGLWSRRRTFEAESAVARKLLAMMGRGDADYDLSFSSDGLKLDQLQALQAMRRARVFSLIGSPGVGKTSTIRAILSKYSPDDIALAAPSGKAAKRIHQLTGRPAKTIHRLLEVAGKLSEDYGDLPYSYSRGFKFRRRHDNPLDARLVIIDEASMVPIELMADLCSALRDNARLILIGDSFQLPAVGPGSVLRDLIQSGVVPHFELTELKRQDPKLLIARNCRSIRYEKRITVDNRGATDFFFIPADDPEEISELVVGLVTTRLPSKFGLDPNRDIITLTARRKHGATGAEHLNSLLRRQLNPKGTGCYAPGDRVIQLHNDYERDIMNGDIGTVAVVGDDGGIGVELEVPPRTVRISRQDANLAHAWGLTTHKGQGSEWACVVVPMHEEQGDFVVSAQHFYTAISRARDVCVVVGQRSWMDHVAANHRDDKRVTRLATLLNGGYAGVGNGA